MPKKFEDVKLQALLDENSARTLEELVEILNVNKSTISDRLRMEKIKKESKWGFHMNYLNSIQNC